LSGIARTYHDPALIHNQGNTDFEVGGTLT
jgi:hypothetical protein